MGGERHERIGKAFRRWTAWNGWGRYKSPEWCLGFPFGRRKSGATFHWRKKHRRKCWLGFSGGKGEEGRRCPQFYISLAWGGCMTSDGDDLKTSWQAPSNLSPFSQCAEQEWLHSAWLANITSNMGRTILKIYLWAGINSRSCCSLSKLHSFLIHLSNQSGAGGSPVPTKIEGEMLECRRKGQGGRKLFGNHRSQLRNTIILPHLPWNLHNPICWIMLTIWSHN